MSEDCLDEAGRVLEALARAGVDLDDGHATSCSTDGVDDVLEPRSQAARRDRDSRRAARSSATSRALSAARCPEPRTARVDAAIARLARRRQGRAALWARDATLWTGADEATLARLAGRTRSTQLDARAPLRRAAPTRSARRGFTRRGAARHGRLEPLPGGARAHLRARGRGLPRLHVLDSTDPAADRAVRGRARPGEDAVHRLVASRARRSSRTSSPPTSARA